MSVQSYTDATQVHAAAGDAVLVATGGLVGRLIRLVTRGWCNHAAIVVSGGVGPQVIVSQATPGAGGVFSPITALGARRVDVISLADVDPRERADVIEFARYARGKRYGYLQIVADLFNAAFRLELDMGWGNHMVCSTATTRALERTGWIPPKAPAAMTPVDIGRAFGAT